ncbi:hypothetical protein [Blastomonas sp. UPD001]|uniref:hypothetical protein n=1 Tax=Blastomonas sp. UPD001 TaxID=2217673 RepID=UPI001E43064A|nr:hypothetical protein [Blastomonas sp. UPD001]
MTMTKWSDFMGLKRSAPLAVLAVALAAMPQAAHAQQGGGADPGIGQGQSQGQGGRSGGLANGRRSVVIPYLEVGQVLSADLKNGGDLLTYSLAAVGVDAAFATSRAEAQVSVRYERRFSWNDDFGDEDAISGVARGNVQIIPNTLSLEAGALGVRSRVDNRGAAPSNLIGGSDNVTQIYSVYAGPTLATQVGTVDVNALYRIGYTKVEADTVALPVGQRPLDLFDDSVNHAASLAIGQQPGGFLPIGWSVSGGWYREDASQLDQRFDDKIVRADVTVPVSATLALVGGVGYEDIEISERDAVRDATGAPVVGRDGRLVTDKASPRLLSYDQDGLIWDVGVLWRPSRRTSLEARVGKRYDSMTYYGTFSYTPNQRMAANLTVYDLVAGFGSRLNDNLSGLPTQFDATRNPLSGDLNSCFFGVGGGGNCLNDALQSVASSAFRTRGVTGQISLTSGSWQHGFGAGYSRRKFFAADNGALAGFDQTIDEIWFASYVGAKQLDARSSITGTVYANYLENGPGQVLNGGGSDVLGIGTNVAYGRNFTNRFNGTLALGLDYFDPQGFESSLVASALLALRYSFQ